jgi:hypothetical protein
MDWMTRRRLQEFHVDPDAESRSPTDRSWGDDRDWHDTVALRRQLEEACA